MVVLKNPNEYIVVGFEKSTQKSKKYDAILEHKESDEKKRVPFGDKRYKQYRDITGLKLYTHKDHGDDKKRKQYKARHSKASNNKFSSLWFSLHYLW